MVEKGNCNRVVNCAFETYPEDSDWRNPIDIAEQEGYMYVTALHDKDVDENGNPKKEHCHILVHLKNGMTLSAIKKKFRVNYVVPIKDFDAYGIYLTHCDAESISQGKYKYGLNVLGGNGKNRIENKLKKINSTQKHENDNDIILILDFVESCDYVSTAILIRWAVENNLYSVLRRSGKLISDVLYEHNRNCEFTLKDTLYEMKLKDMERRMTRAEKELEKAYGDFFERISNPFVNNGISNHGVDYKTIQEIQRGIKEIEEVS